MSSTTNTKTLYETITYPEVKQRISSQILNSPIQSSSPKSEINYAYKTLNDSIYTLAPTNCNYINHVHWTNTYPVHFLTHKNSHKYLCVLKDMYRKIIDQPIIQSLQPIEMRCNEDHLPKRHDSHKSRFQSLLPRLTSPGTTRHSQRVISPQQRHHKPNAHAQPVNVAYARQYMEQQPPNYSHQNISYHGTNPYKMPATFEPLWKPRRRYNHLPPQLKMPPQRQPKDLSMNSSRTSQSSSFIDIPIHSPTYNIKIPPLRIPITQLTSSTITTPSPSTSSSSRYKTQPHHYSSPYFPNYNNNTHINSHTTPTSSNVYYDFLGHQRQKRYHEQYPLPATSSLKSLLQMEPKSRYAWS